MYGWANAADVELKFTTAGAVPSRSAGSAARVTRKVPIRLTRSTSSNSASDVSRKCFERRMPATFTSVSNPPSAPTASATPEVTDFSSPTLILTLVRRPPTSPALVAVSARPRSLMSADTTCPPSSRMRSTQACPMPDPPPVIRTRRSV